MNHWHVWYRNDATGEYGRMGREGDVFSWKEMNRFISQMGRMFPHLSYTPVAVKPYRNHYPVPWFAKDK